MIKPRTNKPLPSLLLDSFAKTETGLFVSPNSTQKKVIKHKCISILCDILILAMQCAKKNLI